ncbi:MULTISPECIES: AlpA family transcriptional regulator [unclassified Pseudomonas]|uniref:helix-turn-helix transcriptional regulator n=1 Tax=unclassified Pseudomonas TaxID=196821 RepID=UPI00131C6FF4|nr:MULTISPECIES: transcriptional regulator [unclassified Pseudomonas]
MHHESILTQGLIRKVKLCQQLGITSGGLDKLKKRDPSFPKPIKDSDSRQAAAYYVVAEVEAWLQRKVAERDAAQGVAA